MDMMASARVLLSAVNSNGVSALFSGVSRWTKMASDGRAADVEMAARAWLVQVLARH